MIQFLVNILVLNWHVSPLVTIHIRKELTLFFKAGDVVEHAVYLIRVCFATFCFVLISGLVVGVLLSFLVWLVVIFMPECDPLVIFFSISLVPGDLF